MVVHPSLFFLGDLSYYILLSSVHPPPTLVNHPWLSSSARFIGHSLWRSVSCCGPHRSVQGSHPHQCSQGVSCGHLIRRWRLLLGSFGISFAILEWVASGDLALFLPMILACRGQGRPRQYILAVWIPFIRPRALLPLWRGALGLK